MSDQKILMLATFADAATAESVRQSLPQLAAADGITVDEVAQIDRDPSGEVKLAGAGALSFGDNVKKGGIIGAIAGVIFPPSIIGAAVLGAGIGAIGSKLRETVFKQDELKELGETLQPGQSAVLLLGEESNRDYYRRYLSAAAKVSEQTFQANLADILGAEGEKA